MFVANQRRPSSCGMCPPRPRLEAQAIAQDLRGPDAALRHV
jgi:hypothetical protein